MSICRPNSTEQEIKTPIHSLPSVKNLLAVKVTLTDTPEVVDLKREYRALDEQEEALKDERARKIEQGLNIASEQTELLRVRERKAAITRRLFSPGRCILCEPELFDGSLEECPPLEFCAAHENHWAAWRRGAVNYCRD